MQFACSPPCAKRKGNTDGKEKNVVLVASRPKKHNSRAHALEESRTKKQQIPTYSNSNRTTLATLLSDQRVRLTQVGTPVTTTNRDDGQLGDSDSGADSSSDFLGGLDTETDVALGVTDDDDGLEAGALTGTGLLLDGLDLWVVGKRDVRKVSHVGVRRGGRGAESGEDGRS